eukprot:8468773-Pyramimonas_sp.AAC.1
MLSVPPRRRCHVASGGVECYSVLPPSRCNAAIRVEPSGFPPQWRYHVAMRLGSRILLAPLPGVCRMASG